MRLWTRRGVLGAGLLTAGSSASARQGSRFEASEVELTDELTGRTLSRLTDPKTLFHFPHYHHRFMSASGRSLIFAGEPDGTRQLFYYDLRRFRATQLTAGSRVYSHSATVDAEERQMYFLQDDALKRSSLKGRGQHTVFRHPGGWRFTGHMSVSSDDRTAVVVEMREDDFRNDPTEQFAQRPQCRLRLIDLLTGADRVLTTDRAWITHPQLRPGRRELSYRHEGPADQVENRLYWTNIDRHEPVPVRLENGGRIEREYWTPSGAELRFVHYPGRDLRGSTIRAIVPETGEQRRIARCSAFGWAQENRDGTAFVGASRRPSGPNIYVLFPQLDREITLCEHGASGKPYPIAGSDELDHECGHPETVFSPDSQWIYFTSDRDGKPALYRMQVEDLVEPT